MLETQREIIGNALKTRRQHQQSIEKSVASVGKAFEKQWNGDGKALEEQLQHIGDALISN